MTEMALTQADMEQIATAVLDDNVPVIEFFADEQSGEMFVVLAGAGFLAPIIVPFVELVKFLTESVIEFFKETIDKIKDMREEAEFESEGGGERQSSSLEDAIARIRARSKSTA